LGDRDRSISLAHLLQHILHLLGQRDEIDDVLSSKVVSSSSFLLQVQLDCLGKFFVVQDRASKLAVTMEWKLLSIALQIFVQPGS
jgi:hypothetical protein